MRPWRRAPLTTMWLPHWRTPVWRAATRPRRPVQEQIFRRIMNDPLVVYAEAEHAIRDLETGARPGLAMGADRRGASDWYYVYRHPEADEGPCQSQRPYTGR
jgi:hypothetical protein